MSKLIRDIWFLAVIWIIGSHLNLQTRYAHYNSLNLQTIRVNKSHVTLKETRCCRYDILSNFHPPDTLGYPFLPTFKLYCKYDHWLIRHTLSCALSTSKFFKEKLYKLRQMMGARLTPWQKTMWKMVNKYVNFNSSLVHWKCVRTMPHILRGYTHTRARPHRFIIKYTFSVCYIYGLRCTL